MFWRRARYSAPAALSWRMSWKPRAMPILPARRRKMNTAKHIVFDWNGTLLDDVDALHECTNRLLESMGHARVEMDDFRANYFIAFDQFYRKLGYDEAQVEKLMSLENKVFHDEYEPMPHKPGL